jgi:uncharacterized protein YbaP (TraB family)
MRIIILPLLLLSISFGSKAQNSVLWEIKHSDLSFSSYLMGTLKFIGEKEYYMPPQAESRIKACKVFTIEDQVDHHAQHELNKVVHFPKGQSLRSVLSADEYTKVTSFFEKEFGIGTKVFEKKYARLIPLALSISMTRLSLGEGVKFYDIELLKVAKVNKLKTFSLESIEREGEAIRKYPIADQVKALLHSTDNFETQKREFSALMNDYPQGNLEEIYEYTLHPVENNPAFIEEFYTKRNLEWFPKIEKMIKDNPSFIAIGISHLEGESGILNLLKQKGYTLVPVPINK